MTIKINPNSCVLFQKSSSGQDLIERVFTYLDIMERDYFGLRFVEGNSHTQGQQWLDPKKAIKKQSRGAKGNPPSITIQGNIIHYSCTIHIRDLGLTILLQTKQIQFSPIFLSAVLPSLPLLLDQEIVH